MGVKVTITSLNWSKNSVPHSPFSPQILASSPYSKRRRLGDRALVFQSALFGFTSTKLHRSKSCAHPKSKEQRIRRACSASLDAFSDKEFSNNIQELALHFQLSDDNDENTNDAIVDSDTENQNSYRSSELEPVEPADWPASIERKANSVDLPLSLRIIKRKKQWQKEFREAGESAYCSVKRAFSSMVFIIREIQSYTLQMREILFYEDLQGILVRVQKEMNASFVWLFQQVFSHTPTLMVYVMILLANYSVYSMSSNAAIAATQLPQVTTESALVVEEDQNYKNPNFDSSAIKRFSLSSASGKTTTIGGNNGGGGKSRAVASGTEGEGRFNGVSSVGNPAITSEDESVSRRETGEEEVGLWNAVVEEASRMEAELKNEALDQETMRRFVSPVSAKIEADDYVDYFRTELLYQTGLVQEPSNTLLLANYAQFLYLVAQDYDRAEEYFKRAVKVEPKDAEALNKYASFLWQVKKDLWAAEETYLEAISVDPSSSYYAANYAHFLWNTGGEDTCFPLTSPDISTQDL